MKNLLQLFIACILTGVSLSAQEANSLIVEYDLFNNKLSYFMNGVRLERPSVREGENIYVRVTEFNPYIMKADLSVKQYNYSQSSNELSGDGYSGGGGGALSGITGLLGGLTMGSNIQQSLGGIPGSRGAASEDVMRSKSEFSQLSQKLAEVEEKMNKSFNKIQLFQKIEQSQKLAAIDIEALKTNQYMQPSRIRELVEEEINYAFAKNKGEKIDIDDLISEMKKEEEIRNSVADYNKAAEEYKELAKKWNSFSLSLMLLSEQMDDMQMEFIRAATDSIQTKMAENIASKLNKPLTANLSPNYAEENLNKMAALRQAYEEMQSNIFTYEFPPIQARSDEVAFEIVVSQKFGKDQYKNYKTLAQTVPVTGGWKLSAGLGLGFGVMNNKSYKYSVVNQTIVADELDDFTPLIISFAHAYKQTDRNLKFGASFGIGFPMQGGSGIQSAAFFLGPTMIVGKRQKFLISTGFMGAKVNRLAGGFEVGDAYESANNTVPTVNNYELGYFIGISYDLLR